MGSLRRSLSIFLAWLLIAQPAFFEAASSQEKPAAVPEKEAAKTADDYASAPSLEEAVALSSWDVAAIAEKFEFDGQKILDRETALKKEKKAKEKEIKKYIKGQEKEVKTKEKELEKVPQSVKDEDAVKARKKIKCEITRIKKTAHKKALEFLDEQNLRDVQTAKLQLLGAWRDESRKVDQEIKDGTIAARKFGNVLDIGSRSTKSPFEGQEKDVQMGKEAIDDAKARGLFPKEITDPVVTEYVNRLVQNLARNSDLTVVPRVFVVTQKVKTQDGKPVLDKNGRPQEVANASMLPGGFMLVYAGIILESENEAQLAGVLAHEIAHAAARHGHQIMSRATKMQIAEQAIFYGLIFLAPGLFSAYSYLAYQLNSLILQGIFTGLGLIFSINLLGVSREFELEADRLGMQYSWRTGYDPKGFVDLFDRFANETGYASHTAFFADHPAFGDRILEGLKEYRALQSVDPNRHYVIDTTEFGEIRERVKGLVYEVNEKEKQEEKDKPTLKEKEPSEEECGEILPPPLKPPEIKKDQPKKEEQKPEVEKPQKPEEDKPPVLKRKDDGSKSYCGQAQFLN